MDIDNTATIIQCGEKLQKVTEIVYFPHMVLNFGQCTQKVLFCGKQEYAIIFAVLQLTYSCVYVCAILIDFCNSDAVHITH